MLSTKQKTMQRDLFTAIEEGERLRDQGMERALAGAERVNPEWGLITYNLFLKFLQEQTEPFMCEDFRSWCALIDDYKFPKEKRAFGPIMTKAAHAGLIRSIGTAKVKNPKAQKANAELWIKK